MRAAILALGPLLFTAAASAQELPYLYFWGAPAGGYGAALTDHASQMVRITLGDGNPPLWDPEDSAAAAVAKAVDQIENLQTTDANHICILIQNFGDMYSYGHDMCFIHPDDDLDEPSSQWSGGPGDIPKLNPWMVHGRASAKQWMEDFIAEYKTLAANAELPDPVRFHFDSELTLSNTHDLNYTKALQAIAEDSRYSDEDYPIGGFSGNKTLQDLFNEVRGPYQWGPSATIVGGTNPRLDVNEQPQEDPNRALFIWYFEVCRTAVDAAMKECAYDVIKDPANFPEALVSNYGDFKADGAVDTFGWYTGRNPDMDPPPATPPALGYTRLCTRGETIGFGEGAKYLWKDIPDNTLRPRSCYYTRRGVASGDFSAPALYPATGEHSNGSQKKYYLKDWPNADYSSIMLANGRRIVESILNSMEVADTGAIVPWIAPPLTPFSWYNGLYSYTTQPIDFRQQLAMLRAKDIRELIIWWDSDWGTYEPLNWPAQLAMIDQVYRPELVDYAVLTGTSSSSDDLSRLTDTLRRTTQADEVLTVESQELEAFEDLYTYVVVKCTFDLHGLGGGAELNLECTVSSTNDTTRDYRGLVYGWDYPHSTWVRAADDNDFTDGFGFHAPLDANGYEARRTFTAPLYVKPDGTADFKIVLRRPIGSPSFTAKFDLIQLVGLPIPDGGGDEQGADFNYSQGVTLMDFSAFMSAYTAGKPSADFNNDGYITAADVAAFTAAYQNP